MELELFNKDPNFSIVVPGGCNAQCSFCFANEQKKAAPLKEYIESLTRTLDMLPPPFYQISITGGEPLLSPYIISILAVLSPYKKKYNNILLTTNGTNLDKLYDHIIISVDHINISRHHYDEAANKAIFGGDYNVTDADIMKYIDMYSKAGIDISANCVIDDSTSTDFIEEYIDWARNIGFAAVRFRKKNGSLDKTPVEKSFEDHKILWKGTCPVCETILQLIHGYRVFWKRSVVEPSKAVSKLFEIVFAPNAKMYADWQYKIAIESGEARQTGPSKIVRNTKPTKRGTAGGTIYPTSCGGSSSDSCGGGSSSRC